MHDSSVSDQIFTALGYLFAAWVCWLVYEMAKKGLGRESWVGTEILYNENETRRDVYIRLSQGLIAIIIIALMAGAFTSHNNNNSSSLNMNTVTFIFTLLVIPFLSGIYAKIEEIKKKEKDKRISKYSHNS